MELKKLIYTVNEDGIAVITMNYMKNLNAIDEQMADELMYVVDAAEKDPNVKVVVGRCGCRWPETHEQDGHHFCLRCSSRCRCQPRSRR